MGRNTKKWGKEKAKVRRIMKKRKPRYPKPKRRKY
jgi:hypothetical protein